MNFFRTVIALCSGTSVFPRLLNVSIFRLILHTCLMIMICTLVFSLSNYFMVVPKMTAATENLFDRIGAIQASDEKISVKNNPEKEQSYLLSDYLRFDYFPSSKFNISGINGWSAQFGLICMRDGFVLWSRENYGEPRYRALFLEPPEIKRYLNQLNNTSDSSSEFSWDRMAVTTASIQKRTKTDLSEAQLKEYIQEEVHNFQLSIHKTGADSAEEPDSPDDASIEGASFGEAAAADTNMVSFDSPARINNMMKLAFGLAFLLVALVQIVPMFLLGAICFTLGQYFKFSGMPHKMSLRHIIVIVVYASFPPMIIATLFSLIPRMIFNYQLIFLIAYLVYVILASASVVKYLYPARSQNIDDDSDY